MKSKSTVVARAPQSRGISASLRRLASRRAVGTLAVGLALAGSLHSASASNQFTGTGATNLFSNPANYSDGIAPIGNGGTTGQNGIALDFNVTTGAQNNLNDDLTGNPNAFTFDAGCNALTIATIAASQFVGSGNVFLNNSSNLQTISAPVSVFGATSDFNAANGDFAFGNVNIRLDINSVNMVLDGAHNGTMGNITNTASGTKTASVTKNGAGSWTVGSLAVGNTLTVNTGLLTISGAGSGPAAGTTIAGTGGSLRLGSSDALGAGTGAKTITINGQGTTGVGGLQLTGGSTISNAINANFSRSLLSAGGSAQIENVSGTNTLTGVLDLKQAGGSGMIIQSDAGLLTLSGTVRTDVGTTTRAVDLGGVGNGLVSGTIINGSGPTQLVKEGSGTWTLSSASNTYTGGTIVSGGTLALGAAAADGTGTLTVNSGGTTTVTANTALGGGNVTLAGGTLANGNTAGTNLTNMQRSGILSLSPGVFVLTASTGTAAPLAAFGPVSTLDFGVANAGAVFSFTGFDPNSTGILSIVNYLGTPNVGLGLDQLFIGTSQTLTASQLGQISFVTGGQTFGATQLASGEVVENALAAAPEPSQYAAFGIGLLGLGALALKARKRTLSA